MSTHSVEIIVRGPEGVQASKTFNTSEAGAKQLVGRFEKNVASHRIMEGIEEDEPAPKKGQVGGPPLDQIDPPKTGKPAKK